MAASVRIIPVLVSTGLSTTALPAACYRRASSILSPSSRRPTGFGSSLTTIRRFTETMAWLCHSAKSFLAANSMSRFGRYSSRARGLKSYRAATTVRSSLPMQRPNDA
jgi:hypothetical protein